MDVYTLLVTLLLLRPSLSDASTLALCEGTGNGRRTRDERRYKLARNHLELSMHLKNVYQVEAH